MTSGSMGVAVIGAGSISDQYLADMVTYPDLDVRFVADIQTDRARAQADRYGVPGSGSVEQVLELDDVELVVNLTIPAAHASVAERALAAGKHVWNEKPLATNRHDARSIVEQAEALGLRLGCAPDTVLGPGIQTARRMIERGDIGRPLTASVVMQQGGPHHWHPNPDFLYQSGGGPLLDMGPYYLTALTQIFGAIRRVSALGSTAGPTRVIGTGARAGESFEVTVPSYVAALYEFRSGAVAQATFSFDSHLQRMGVVEISGVEGTLCAPDPNMFGGLIEVVRGGLPGGATARTSVPAAADGAGRGIGPLDMARAVRSGQPHRANGRVALHVLDALLATQEAIERGELVRIDSELVATDAVPADWDPRCATLG
ncbi:Gfo/Idh/MocA family protein [Angustibacter sp. McL0619]|uniref:Gfo/Idh/MocA family protein n=1 Tax=Angustibacter sp. McL0619 TaxID=3415676 RepID=UPI003CEF9A3E